MKKIFTLFAIFACLPILLSAKGPAVIRWADLHGRYPSHYKVGPGTYYTAIHFYGPKDMRAFYLEIDATNPYTLFPIGLGSGFVGYVRRHYQHGRPKKQRRQPLFRRYECRLFRYFGSYRNSGTRMCGRRPIGESSRNLRALKHLSRQSTNASSRSSLTPVNSPSNETTYTIHNVNGSRSTYRLVLDNRYVGNYTHTNAYGYGNTGKSRRRREMGSEQDHEAESGRYRFGSGNMAIAENGAVLSGHGTSADFCKPCNPATNWK